MRLPVNTRSFSHPSNTSCLGLEPLHEVLHLDLLRQGDNKVLVHGHHRVDVDLALLQAQAQGGIGAVRLRLELQALEDLLLDGGVGDGRADAVAVVGLDHARVALRVGLELALGDELAKVDAPAQRLQHGDVARGAAAVVLLADAPIAVAEAGAHAGQEGLDVELLDLVVDVDVVGVEDPGVVDGGEDGPVEGLGEEGVLVGGLVAADQGLELLLLEEVPVHEREVAAGYGHGAGDVDVAVDGELDPLDQVEGYGVLQATAVVNLVCQRVTVARASR